MSAVEERIRKHVERQDQDLQELKDWINAKLLDKEAIKDPDFFSLVEVELEGQRLKVYKGLLTLSQRALTRYQRKIITAARQGQKLIQEIR